MKPENITYSISKSFKIARVGLTLVVGQACEGILKEEVISNVGNDYLNTPAGVNDGLDAAYGSCTARYGPARGNTVTIFGTDTHPNGADGAFQSMNFYASGPDTLPSDVRELWDQ